MLNLEAYTKAVAWKEEATRCYSKFPLGFNHWPKIPQKIFAFYMNDLNTFNPLKDAHRINTEKEHEAKRTLIEKLKRSTSQSGSDTREVSH